MSVKFPDGFKTEKLSASHKKSKKVFDCGEDEVDSWLQSRALQTQKKKTTSTTVLVDGDGAIAGYYTVVIGAVNFSKLPQEIAKKLPKEQVPVITFAWLGVDKNFQGQGLGYRLALQALCDCYEVGQIVDFVGVVIDCLSDEAKKRYVDWFGFVEFPGHPMKLFLSKAMLDELVSG